MELGLFVFVGPPVLGLLVGCGEIDGAEVGLLLGWPDGCPEGCIEGLIVGREDNAMVGAVVGRHVGVCPNVL